MALNVPLNEALKQRVRGTLLERFEPLARLREGGMGKVWVARDRQLARTVAIKFLSDELTRQPDVLTRFLTEARIAAQLEHPNIVPVYALEYSEGGLPAFVMQLVEGETLAEYLERCGAVQFESDLARQGENLKQRLSRLLPICDAIDYAHGRRVIHRDVKPSNILLGQYNESLLTDWGIAHVDWDLDLEAEVRRAASDVALSPSDLSVFGTTRLDSPAGSLFAAACVGVASVEAAMVFDPTIVSPLDSALFAPANVTRSGQAVGTLEYMAPEQLVDSATVTEAADQFSLGLVALELATLRRARDKSKPSGELLDDVRYGRYCSFVDRWGKPLDVRLTAILERALSFGPGERYSSVGQFGDDLRRYLRGEALAVLPDNLPRRFVRRMEEHPVWASVAILGTLLVASLLTLYSVLSSEQRVENWAHDSATLTHLTAETARRTHGIEACLLATQASVASLAVAAVEHIALDRTSGGERSPRAEHTNEHDRWKLLSRRSHAAAPSSHFVWAEGSDHTDDADEELERTVQLSPLIAEMLLNHSEASQHSGLDLDDLCLALRSGTYLELPGAAPLPAGFDARELDWYVKYHGARSPTWQPMATATNPNRIQLGLVVPLLFGSESLGLIGAFVPFDRLAPELLIPNERRLTRAIIADDTANVLWQARPGGSDSSGAVLPLPLIRAIQQHRSYGRLWHEDRLWLFNRLDTIPWYYITEFPSDVLIEHE